MFRRKLVVWHEHRRLSLSRDVACQMAKCLCRAPIEPPTMDMHHSVVGPLIFGSAPPPWNAANMVSFVRNTGRRRDALHDGIKRNPGRCSLKPSFVGFDDGAHGSHRSLILRAKWMQYGPVGRIVIFKKCHDFPPQPSFLIEAQLG
jgi:hypothetical protein